MREKTNLSRHIRRECLTSGVISSLISLGFFWAIFGFETPVDIWSVGNFVFDFLPQGFAITFFASLVSSFLTHKAVLSGRLDATREMPCNLSVLFASIARALVGAALLAGLATIFFWVTGLEALAAIPALAIKMIVGGVLGAMATRASLRAMLR
ncbi:hypothetical protein [Novosphingobium profundi]|uniref:hypothetical protein n=1 Tax=Novosphingobium profundi TaxID=1774954 RepID=UPI001CFDD22C|nr:hypothetical protein [Novosphingobium profundi]